MRRAGRGGLAWIESENLRAIPGLRHAFSTRKGGVSPLPEDDLSLGLPGVPPPGKVRDSEVRDCEANVSENRRRFFEALEFQTFPKISLRQTHSDIIHFVKAPTDETLVGDGVFTACPELVIGVGTADCLPVLFAHKHGGFVGAVHAGWRGTAARICELALKRACETYNASPSDILVALGPCIGPCCYAVGEEVREEFEKSHADAMRYFSKDKNGNLCLDFARANADQLLENGLPENNLERYEGCTACESELFFSYRKDGPGTGRMQNVIARR